MGQIQGMDVNREGKGSDVVGSGFCIGSCAWAGVDGCDDDDEDEISAGCGRRAMR